MPASTLRNEIDNCASAINEIPANEIKYYLLLMLNAIKKVDDKQAEESNCRQLLEEMKQLSNELTIFINMHKGNKTQLVSLSKINQHYRNMCNISMTNTYSVKTGYTLINVGSAITAFFTGVLGGLIGGVSGLVRSIATFSDPLSHLKTGLITGVLLGSAIGFRAPKKILKDELTRQLKYCLDGLAECINNVKTVKPLSYFKKQVKNERLQKYFDDNEDEYNAFLSQQQSYQISTLSAQFISEQLEGYLGHHTCIIINLPKGNIELIEFAPDKSDVIHRKHTQDEKRFVSGEKIVEMMALHQQLKVTHECNTNYIVTKMKSGENDCLSYINKILVGTNQDATKVKRFDGSENWVGRNIIGFFVQKLSPFSQDILDNKDTHLRIDLK